MFEYKNNWQDGAVCHLCCLTDSFARIKILFRLMSVRFRTCWLVAFAILLVAEDFQYLLKIEPAAFEQTAADLRDFCDDSEEEGEKKNEEGGKEENEKKDENRNNCPQHLLYSYSAIAKNAFRDAFYLLSDIAHELETPPPEV